nr:MAG TPA: hypothetical protein [Caudoviricetes sp.]
MLTSLARWLWGLASAARKVNGGRKDQQDHKDRQDRQVHKDLSGKLLNFI